jgi:hypothetical protein
MTNAVAVPHYNVSYGYKKSYRKGIWWKLLQRKKETNLSSNFFLFVLDPFEQGTQIWGGGGQSVGDTNGGGGITKILSCIETIHFA